MYYFYNLNAAHLGLFFRIASFFIILYPFLFSRLINFTVKTSLIFALYIFLFPAVKSVNVNLINEIAIGVLLGLTVSVFTLSFELFSFWIARLKQLSFEEEYVSIKNKNSFKVLYGAVFLFFLSMFSEKLGIIFEYFIQGFIILPSGAESNFTNIVDFAFSFFKIALSLSAIFFLPMFIAFFIFILCSAFVRKYFPSFKEGAIFSTASIQLIMILVCYLILNIESTLDKLFSENINQQKLHQIRDAVK